MQQSGHASFFEDVPDDELPDRYFGSVAHPCAMPWYIAEGEKDRRGDPKASFYLVVSGEFVGCFDSWCVQAPISVVKFD